MPTFLSAPTGLSLTYEFVDGKPVVTALWDEVTDAVHYRLSVHPASATRAAGPGQAG